MKKMTILLIVLVVFISCSKEGDTIKNTSCMKSEESFNNDKRAVLNLTSQLWQIEENEISGVNVSVTINGKIQGDSATIRTYGDGLISDAKIELDSKNEFNQNFGIFFTSSLLTEEYVSANTLIMVFSGQDTLKAEINSCSLYNIQYQ